MMQNFQSLRIIKERNLLINAPVHEVFPLLCPVREYEWIEPWQCKMLYSDTGMAENNCIFETDFDHNGGRETWFVSRYETDRCIEFVRFTDGEKIVKLDVESTANGDGFTRLLWRKIFSGLSSKGNALIGRMANEQFAPEAAAIEKMLNHFLTTGEMLRIETPA